MESNTRSAASNLAATVNIESRVVEVSIHDARPDVQSFVAELSPEQQEQLAIDAWSVGLRALKNAHSQAQEARLQDIGQTLLGDLESQLRRYVEGQQKTLGMVLGKYFDPQDGQVSQRLREFVDDQGALARVLQRFMAPSNSVLAETLARQVGEQSPLFRKLSSTDSTGLVKVLENRLQEVMERSHGELVRALDPLAEDGAVARFLRSLREEIAGADQDRARQLAAALAALDANNKDSLLNRLVRETDVARQSLLVAINPDAPGSPVAALKHLLTTKLEEHVLDQRAFMKLQTERQEKLESEIRVALARLDERKSALSQSPRGGRDFEEALGEFVVAAVRGAPCTVELTGSTVGARRGCKVGDVVVRFTDESAFSGSGVVIEAKRDASYTPARALEELDLARANRSASSAIMVMAASHASTAFSRLARHGHNVIVVWDETDPASDPYLHAALLLGLSLVARSHAVADKGDIAALRDVEERLEAELARMDKMHKSNEGIRKHSDAIAEEIRKSQGQLDLLIQKARSALKALHVELVDEDSERKTPISMAAGSLANARAALALTPKVLGTDDATGSPQQQSFASSEEFF